MSNFDKYLDILSKGRSSAENRNPNRENRENRDPGSPLRTKSPLRPKKGSPLRQKVSHRATLERDDGTDFTKVEMPFNFHTLLREKAHSQVAQKNLDEEGF